MASRRCAAALRGGFGALLIAGACAPAAAAKIEGEDGRPVAARTTSTVPRHQLRCWQNGRLLFEQETAAPPVPASDLDVRLKATDRAKAPIVVYETRHATCLQRTTRQPVDAQRPAQATPPRGSTP